MPDSIYHLERFDGFLTRIVELNKLYAPDDGSHAAILAGEPSAEETRRTLHLIHRHFPRQAPAHEQAAYLVRAFTGLRPFAEANHRTGWDFTAEALSHAGRELTASTDEGRELGNSLWEELDGMSGDDLEGRGEDFQSLAAWFQHRIS